jgi:hypothetical protein
MSKKITVAILIIAAFIFGCAKEKKPSEPTLAVVGLHGGDTVRVAVGANFSATFMISNATNVYAIAAMVKYDTSYLSVMESSGRLAEKGAFLGSTGDLTAAFVNGIPGTIVFAYSKQGDNLGSDGDGDLWRISMTALKPGLTKISFEPSRCFVMSPNVIGNELERLPARFDDKLIKIESEPVPAEGDTSIIYIRID